MANLKGSTFEKQVKDIHHRTSAFGEGRHGKNDHQTHSSALADKRSEMSRSFAQWAENKGFSGKLNEHMTNDNIKEFLDTRTAELAPSTAENYVRGFSSLVEGLKEANVTIEADRSVFDNKAHEIKENYTSIIETGRAIENVDKVIENIYNTRYESGVIAEVQRELGLREREAYELVKNQDKYIRGNEVKGIIGKGNHEYDTKQISNELIAKIEQCSNIPAISTYNDHLAKEDISSHDFRYTFVKEHMHELSKQELSKELNHNREEITNRYIARL